MTTWAQCEHGNTIVCPSRETWLDSRNPAGRRHSAVPPSFHYNCTARPRCGRNYAALPSPSAKLHTALPIRRHTTPLHSTVQQWNTLRDEAPPHGKTPRTKEIAAWRAALQENTTTGWKNLTSPDVCVCVRVFNSTGTAPTLGGRQQPGHWQRTKRDLACRMESGKRRVRKSQLLQLVCRCLDDGLLATAAAKPVLWLRLWGVSPNGDTGCFCC